MDQSSKLISIVVPVYHSADILPVLAQSIEEERVKNQWNLEFILVEDGSSDNSFTVIKELKKKYPYIKGFRLSRNFGQQAALTLGLEKCQGEYIGIIDDDMQDPPSLLPNFFKKLDEGYDVAYGTRRKRKESLFKRMAYKSFYKILRFVSDIEIPLDSGDFCVMRRPVAENMLKLQERNPFLRGIRSWVGFKQIGIEYERKKRHAGESNYSLKGLFKMAFDGIFSFSYLPLRIITLAGGIGLSVSFLYFIFLVYTYFNRGFDVKGFPTIILMILFWGSLQLLCLGIIGEYISRIYNEGKNRPHFILGESTEE